MVRNECDILQEGLAALGCSARSEQVQGLISYLSALEVTNRSFNLTRIPRADYVTLHVLDSLLALPLINNKTNPSILDIGTGAGFPGVPLAALLPNAHVTLVDSTAKKVRFVEETARACGFTNCSVIHARAESLAKNAKHYQGYDVVVSRAVASFDRLLEWMLPFVKRGGRAIALKGSKALEELAGTESLIQGLGGLPATVHTFTIPTTDIERQLIVVDKS